VGTATMNRLEMLPAGGGRERSANAGLLLIITSWAWQKRWGVCKSWWLDSFSRAVGAIPVARPDGRLADWPCAVRVSSRVDVKLWMCVKMTWSPFKASEPLNMDIHIQSDSEW